MIVVTVVTVVTVGTVVIVVTVVTVVTIVTVVTVLIEKNLVIYFFFAQLFFNYLKQKSLKKIAKNLNNSNCDETQNLKFL